MNPMLQTIMRRPLWPARTYSRRRARRLGFSLIEMTIASAISAVASVGVMAVFVLGARFVVQGTTESRILSRGALTLESMTRTLNHAYRPDALVAANRPVIDASRSMITFTLPLANGTDEVQRFRFAGNDREIFYESQGPAGDWTSMTQRQFLPDVEDFFVENQEGILSLVLSMRVDMTRNGEKRYTLIGRALPRNL